MYPHISRLGRGISGSRFPLSKLFRRIRDNKIQESEEHGSDERYRPSFVMLQAAFELAAAEQMRISEGELQWKGIIHTPTLIKPLTAFPHRDLAQDVLDDQERFNTVRVRAEESLPSFMRAGGVIVAAAKSLDLPEKQQKTFDTHKQEYGDNLQVQALETLPHEMGGASYFLGGEDASSMTVNFAFIRAQQADNTAPMIWRFGMGNINEDTNILREYVKTVSFLTKNELSPSRS